MSGERRNHIAALQRTRRSKLRRIDYYPSEAAAALIESLRRPGIGGDASSIINRIVEEWASRNKGRLPEFSVSVMREAQPASGILPVHHARGRVA